MGEVGGVHAPFSFISVFSSLHRFSHRRVIALDLCRSQGGVQLDGIRANNPAIPLPCSWLWQNGRVIRGSLGRMHPTVPSHSPGFPFDQKPGRRTENHGVHVYIAAENHPLGCTTTWVLELLTSV